MRRKLFTLAAAGSALLCAAVAALWGWSYLPNEVRLGVADGRLVVVGVDSGRKYADDLWDAEGSRREVAAMLLRHATTRHGVPGIVYAEGMIAGTSASGHAWGGPYGANYALLSIHCGYLLLLLAILPALWFRARRRRKRWVRDGHCAACGYDLRASPGRCPECGAVPNTSAA